MRLRAQPHNLMVTVQAGARLEPGLLTCHAKNSAHPPEFEVLDVRELA